MRIKFDITIKLKKMMRGGNEEEKSIKIK